MTRHFSEEHRKKISISMKKRLENKFNHPMFGKKHTLSARKKMSVKLRGRILSREWIEKSKATRRRLYSMGKLVAWNKGLKGIKTNNKGHIAWNRGIQTGPLSAVHKKNISLGQMGRMLSPETRKKISLSKKGLWVKEKNPNWRGGITPLESMERMSDAYKDWRNNVFARDNYICQICGVRGTSLRANHIKRFGEYPELRTVAINGITICKKCDLMFVLHREPEWENYFNFNLETREILESDFISIYLKGD